MLIELLKGKIHRATVNQSEPDYVGSITIDKELLDASHIFEFEKVKIVDIQSNASTETYVITGPRGSGMICLNGALSQFTSIGSKITILSYCMIDTKQAKEYKPLVAVVDEKNKIKRSTRYG